MEQQENADIQDASVSGAQELLRKAEIEVNTYKILYNEISAKAERLQKKLDALRDIIEL